MCSVNEATNNVLESAMDRLDNDNRQKDSLDLRNDTAVHDALMRNFDISKSKVQRNRQEAIQAATVYLREPFSKIADTINIDQSTDVRIGHVINITENILLNTQKNELEIQSNKGRDFTNYFPMIDRMHWLAEPCRAERTYLPEPARFVIICHTATDESYTQAENVLMLRLLQTFHIESQGWSDIAYNFCVGCDGNVYEGRGWFIQGSHTLNYNKYAMGIAFIGCFVNKLPPQQSLKACKDLINHGIRIGAISPNYQLLAHSQCRPFQSPGDKLVDEIKTWKNFNPEISVRNPAISFED
uniref:Peptidoglycan recognition protein L2 n=1 Tax=Rhynchophorus ferrugineus TaxID=354439 RepID=A0A8K1ILS0_RHYFE|nr:peptidoglycan recognition protein L2 [Rhynchophorus ferrugineus]